MRGYKSAMGLILRYIILSGIASVLLPSVFVVNAQERCGTVQYSKLLHSDHQLRKIDFEKWIAEKKVNQRENRNGRRQTTLYKIPVVVHIIHNGEAIGSGANIPDAQILSQIKVLNQDFQRQNPDAANTPAQFASVAGSLDVEFVLAKQDPDGQPTNGIVRVHGGRDGWTINDDYTMKALSYWPAEEYMNIWVCNLIDQYIGYAQRPESHLQGLENSSTNRLTDGVVIWHRAFGSDDDGPFNLDPAFNKGRTTTHEAGHFFGLNHIWGDDEGCAGSDYVGDTPNQGPRSVGCPPHPKTDACGQVVMFQNFLDYSDDDCMNLFTQGQVERMTIVIENSPRRKTLLTSPGQEEPAPLPNDIGVRSIVFPDVSVCSNDIIPVIELRNYGSNTVTSARIRFSVDGSVRETKDFALNLAPEQSVAVVFSQLNLASGAHEISFRVLLTNGGADSGNYNDEEASTVIVPAFSSVPFTENFTTQPSGWITQNFDSQVTWQNVTAPNENASNKALKLNFFEYEDKLGEVDIFLGPVLDLSGVPAAALTFDVAHARYQGSNDRLRVIVLTNCEDISQGDVLYDKAGDALKTAGATSQPFTPSGPAQWRKELINLSGYIGMDKVQLAFVGINDWGNNLFIDNIAFLTDATRDASLAGLSSPSIVTCENTVTPRILVQNSGSIPLNNFDVEYSLNGSAVQSRPYTGLNIPFGTGQEIDLPALALSDGENILEVSIENPNGGTDNNTINNSGSFVIVLNKSEDRIPLRENFEGDFTSAWTMVNPKGGMNWEAVDTNFGQSVYFNSFDNSVIGDEAWLVSPVLDFSGATQATMLFDVSYFSRPGASETLSILASTDCGVTFNNVSYSFPETSVSSAQWLPASEENWHRQVSVNLNSLAKQDNVRIAFALHNQNGNNLYLDNIEFFVTADPGAVDITELYSVYGYDLENPELTDLKIAFNLPDRQDVRYTIINAIGQMETDGVITDVLNQTFQLDLSRRLAPGVYIVRLQIAGKFYSSRLLVF